GCAGPGDSRDGGSGDSGSGDDDSCDRRSVSGDSGDSGSGDGGSGSGDSGDGGSDSGSGDGGSDNDDISAALLLNASEDDGSIYCTITDGALVLTLGQNSGLISVTALATTKPDWLETPDTIPTLSGYDETILTLSRTSDSNAVYFTVTPLAVGETTITVSSIEGSIGSISVVVR
ncbi:MAG: hypothetical protein LIO60_05465, partial [Oscillospiraceae bacterium]|nr:hypothetical protein [Oscillospiraceae bacterium]